MYINTQTLTQHSEQDIRSLNPNTSFGNPFVPPAEYFWVFPAPQPAYNAVTQSVREIAPVLTVKGHCEQSWEIIELDAESIAANQAAEVIRLEAVEASRIASLWQAAHDYEYAQVSGSAIGLLAIGVLQGLPKCIAVQNWIKGIWTEYYTRKAGTSTDTDFSIAGECPHSVPELMEELGL